MDGVEGPTERGRRVHFALGLRFHGAQVGIRCPVSTRPFLWSEYALLTGGDLLSPLGCLNSISLSPPTAPVSPGSWRLYFGHASPLKLYRRLDWTDEWEASRSPSRNSRILEARRYLRVELICSSLLLCAAPIRNPCRA